MSVLAGKRILVTRPREQAAPLVDRLVELGAVPVLFPTIEIVEAGDTAPIDQAIRAIDAYRWVIFTSVNGVSAFWRRLSALGMTTGALGNTRVAAIGPATAQALQERGIQPDFVPAEYVAEAIVPGLGDIRGQRILLPRADIARKALVSELNNQGAIAEEIAVYRTRLTQPDEQAFRELERGIDIATFTSSSTVRNWMALLGDRAVSLLKGAGIVCIGPITAETARECGLAVDLIAQEYTIDGLLDALVTYARTTDEEERTGR